MAKIKFKIAVKTDVGLARTNNEDNFQASSDLMIKPMKWVNNEVCQLNEKGALLVVADGMGGMNAGEVASQIAIDVIREEFDPDKLTSTIMQNRFTIEKFMNDVIVKADKKIKETAQKNPDTKGMGTTIVIAWLLRDELYVSWCGDSRAYVFNPFLGLHRLTKDHSYVQELVDSGKLTEDEAFDYPDNNIITKCLSASTQKAQPESLFKPYKVSDNDIILLCTDGLCGMINDMEIHNIIKNNTQDLKDTTEKLVQAALNASGADNVTICLCQIVSGGSKIDPTYFIQKSSLKKSNNVKQFAIRLFNKFKTLILCMLFLFMGVGLTFLFLGNNACSNNKQTDVINDSIDFEKDSIKSDSLNIITNDHVDNVSNDVGLENKTLNSVNSDHVKISDMPNTEKKRENRENIGDNGNTTLTPNSNEEEPSEESTPVVEVVRQVIKVPMPDGINISQFAQQHGMNYKDMKHLNPDIKDWRNIQPGTLLKVYKQ